MNDKTLILRLNIEDYFFPYIINQYNVHQTVEGKADHLYMIVSNKLGFRFQGIGKGWIHSVKYYDKVVMFDYGWFPYVTEYIKRLNPNCKINLIYFNKISNDTHFSILKDRNIDNLWTFDSEDAHNYGLKLNTSCYTNFVPFNCENDSVVYDLVFVGMNKGRKDKIEYVTQYCNDNHLFAKVIIPQNKSEYVSYDKYLELISHSKAILEIVVEGQTGNTMRAMESIFLKRKLITNNVSIINADFYDENNIFIIGKDKIDNLVDFINTPFKEIDPKIMNYYLFENWLDRFK